MPQLIDRKWRGMNNGTQLGDYLNLDQAEIVWTAYPVDLLATGQTSIIPVQPAGNRFIPTRVVIELTAVTGALGAPIVRLGNNGTWDNIAPLATLTGLNTQYETISIPLNTPVNSIDLSATAISFDVQTAGTVATIATASVYLIGILRLI